MGAGWIRWVEDELMTLKRELMTLKREASWTPWI
jgi:hypothetical protein